MNKHDPFFAQKVNRPTLAIGFIMLVALIGCVQSYGRFVYDRQVDHAFETGMVSPELKYYYWGDISKPYAIVGIHEAYRLSSRLWKAFDPTTDQFTQMSGNMGGAAGFNMVGADGTVVGVWYSWLDHRTVQVDEENKLVKVMFKDPSHH